MREGDPAFEALRKALDSFAADRAPELVAEAEAEAVARVRSMLPGRAETKVRNVCRPTWMTT